MAVLRFRWADVAPIYAHAVASPRFSMSFSEQIDVVSQALGVSDDEAIGRLGEAAAKQALANASGEPGLFLVGDRGVYLMSAGQPILSDGSPHGSVVAYADGIDPDVDDDWYEAKRRTFGGDDGADKLPLSFFEAWIKAGSRSPQDWLTIRLTADAIELVP